mmetsp:Transcript_15364/g.34431  ORF Transcript_15364/g.34431 Transcript_15364/m.34431 type:complete len:471 (-) Transcript_15364:128-1540(-)
MHLHCAQQQWTRSLNLGRFLKAVRHGVVHPAPADPPFLSDPPIILVREMMRRQAHEVVGRQQLPDVAVARTVQHVRAHPHPLRPLGRMVGRVRFARSVPHHVEVASFAFGPFSQKIRRRHEHALVVVAHVEVVVAEKFALVFRQNFGGFRKNWAFGVLPEDACGFLHQMAGVVVDGGVRWKVVFVANDSDVVIRKVRFSCQLSQTLRLQQIGGDERRSDAYIVLQVDHDVVLFQILLLVKQRTMQIHEVQPYRGRHDLDFDLHPVRILSRRRRIHPSPAPRARVDHVDPAHRIGKGRVDHDPDAVHARFANIAEGREDLFQMRELGGIVGRDGHENVSPGQDPADARVGVRFFVSVVRRVGLFDVLGVVRIVERIVVRIFRRVVVRIFRSDIQQRGVLPRGDQMFVRRRLSPLNFLRETVGAVHPKKNGGRRRAAEDEGERKIYFTLRRSRDGGFERNADSAHLYDLKRR